jgi:hypothetical protein
MSLFRSSIFFSFHEGGSVAQRQHAVLVVAVLLDNVNHVSLGTRCELNFTLVCHIHLSFINVSAKQRI